MVFDRTRSGKLLSATACALVFTVPVILVFISVLNVFYSVGDMVDPGWLATIAWHNTWQLLGPPGLPDSYLREHVSPIFWLTNLVSYILPLPKFDFFGLFLGVAYGLYAAAIYRLWQSLEDKPATMGKAIPAMVLAIIVAWAATFSAVGMQALRLPHHEMILPAFVLWFFLALADDKIRAARVWFVLSLMVREDAGFHLFGLIFLWLMAGKVFRRPQPNAALIWKFAAIGLAYSIALMILKSFISVSPNVLVRSYIGSPPWGHVTPDLIAARLHFYATEGAYIYIPLLLTAVWAILARNPLLPLGYLAFVPWLALSFFGTNETTSRLAYYYAFPFWISLAWPLLALRFWPVKSRPGRWPYALVLLASLIVWRFDHLEFTPTANNFFAHSPFDPRDFIANRRATDAFTDYFVTNQLRWNSMVLGMDMSVHGLLIDVTGRAVWLQDLKDKGIVPDTIIYYAGAFEWPGQVLPMLQVGGYGYFYKVDNSLIRIASRYDLTQRLPAPQPFIPMSSPYF